MPIKKYIPDTTFGPETIKDMTTAFERIRRVLKLKDPDDPLIEVVAKKVISLASQGTHDPKEIERLVIADTKRTEVAQFWRMSALGQKQTCAAQKGMSVRTYLLFGV